MDEQTLELLDCKCGGVSIIITVESWPEKYYVKCTKCDCKSEVFTHRHLAKAYWNNKINDKVNDILDWNNTIVLCDKVIENINEQIKEIEKLSCSDRSKEVNYIYHTLIRERNIYLAGREWRIPKEWTSYVDNIKKELELYKKLHAKYGKKL
jgi:hypothetical protein